MSAQAPPSPASATAAPSAPAAPAALAAAAPLAHPHRPRASAPVSAPSGGVAGGHASAPATAFPATGPGPGAAPSSSSPSRWLPVPHTALVDGVVLLHFDASALPADFVSLNAGDAVLVLERFCLSGNPSDEALWYRGYVFSSVHAKPLAQKSFSLGVFPARHIAFVPKKVKAKGVPDNLTAGGTSFNWSQFGPHILRAVSRLPPPTYPKYDSVIGSREPLVDDLSAALIEWAGLLKKHLLSQNYTLYNTATNLSLRLYKGRNQLLVSALSQERLIKIRNQLVDILEFGDYIQGLSMIVRHRSRGHLLGDKYSASIIKVFRTHFESHERLRLSDKSLSVFMKLHDKVTAERYTLSLVALTISPFGTPGGGDHIQLPHSLQSIHKRTESVQTFFVHFELAACFARICHPGEHAELAFYLYDKVSGKSVSEDFLVRIDSTGLPVSVDADGRLRLKTVFCDLSDPDLTMDGGDFGLCLVVRIVRVGKMNATDRDDFPVSSSPNIPERFVKRAVSSESFMHKRSLSSESMEQQTRSHSSESIRSASDFHGVRRPFAVGVLDLANAWNRFKKLGFADTNAVLESTLAATNVMDGDADRQAIEGEDYTLQLYTAGTESMFPTMAHQILNQQDLQTSPETIKVVLNVSTHTCTVAEPIPVSLVKVAKTERLGFPERIHAHDSRNSVYVTLTSGEFTARATTFAQRNVQVVVQVRTSDGVFIENCISRGF
ncbi:hypothetical protein HDU82_008564, partial [Entophlyctis luteolus]